jgi:hypothetical protein
VSVSERVVDPPDHWPTAVDIGRVVASGAVALLPDRVDERDGRLLASFRPEAQALRVRTKSVGLDAILLMPPGAEAVVYSEYTADWILPVLIAAALTVPANLAADLIHDRIGPESQKGVTLPTVRYREAIIEHGRVRVYEAEGPANEVERLLRARVERAKEAGPGLPPEPPAPGASPPGLPPARPCARDE